MERGDSIGVWVAYGVICLFLLVLVAILARTAILYGSLVVMTLLRRDAGPGEGTSEAEGTSDER